jgi:hypothetical protein
VIFLAGTDLHLASKPPAGRIDADFPEETFELLTQLGDVARQVQARAILWPGDLFHDTGRSRLDWLTLARMASWLLTLKGDRIATDGIPGNHDLKFNRYDTLPNTPLGLLFSMGAMRNVSVTQGETSVVYYRDGEQPVEVQGVPFPDAFALEAWRVPWTAGTQRILLGHCFAAPARGDYFGEPVHSYAELLDVSQADYIVLGHDHTHRGIFRFDESGQARYVLDVGAMARLALSDSDTSRVPMFSVIDTGARSVTPYSFHYRPAPAIFDLDQKAVVEAEAAQLASFADRLKDDLLAQPSASTVEDKLAALSLSGEVRARVLDYIAQAEQAQQEQRDDQNASGQDPNPRAGDPESRWVRRPWGAPHHRAGVDDLAQPDRDHGSAPHLAR